MDDCIPEGACPATCNSAHEGPGCLAPGKRTGWGLRGWDAARTEKPNKPSRFLEARAGWGETEWTLITIWGGFFHWKHVDCVVLWCQSLWAIKQPLPTSKRLELEIWRWRLACGWGARLWGLGAAPPEVTAQEADVRFCPFPALLMKHASEAEQLAWESRGHRGVKGNTPNKLWGVQILITYLFIRSSRSLTKSIC